MIVLNKIQDLGNDKLFLSSLVDKIDYSFSADETAQFSQTLDDSYNKLKNQPSKDDAIKFIGYIAMKHPKIGIQSKN
ncbi:MAG: hypothetical protein Hyperionvirus6_63 [Hyperionvirus sp.]|uniref:Uncharacterized protein n=1 Tax=Hyperionvirus sp. TaxID=2487770 RepID=A0A3G5A8I3_9VIRU|nr:MAG: hypothetical protein Hyperionvirus6_63 [Hyperionvirus sp.]